jgi:hypothetical protein
VSTSSGATGNQRFRTLEGISTSLDRTSVVDGEDVLGVVLQAVPERESNSPRSSAATDAQAGEHLRPRGPGLMRAPRAEDRHVGPLTH